MSREMHFLSFPLSYLKDLCLYYELWETSYKIYHSLEKRILEDLSVNFPMKILAQKLVICEKIFSKNIKLWTFALHHHTD